MKEVVNVKAIDEELWLFDYDDGMAYEAFSRCEDARSQIAKYLEDNYNFRDQDILEIGAGSGKFTGLFKSGRDVYVVERSASLMKINRQKNNSENMCFRLCDVKDLDLSERSVDLIFAGWSLTSMRDSFDLILPVLKNVLRDDGKIVLVENAGDDEFSRIVGIEELSFKMREFYQSIGFIEKALLDTVIVLPDRSVFDAAFPNKTNVPLNSFMIFHRVLILEADARNFYGGG